MTGRRCLAALAGTVILLAAGPPARAVTLEEIILLCKTGVSAEIVIESLRRDPSLPRPTSADVERMRQAGVPGAVIAFLRRPGHGPRVAPRPADSRRRQDEDRKAESVRLREEAERLRQEARRLAEEARRSKARTEEVAGRVKSELDQAYRDLRRGREFRAIARFHQFLHSGLVQPNSYAYLEGSFGLALAFQGAGMEHSAAGMLVEVIRRGPQTPRFEQAVSTLGALMDRISFVHPVIALLAEFGKEVESKPRAWLDEYHYLLGEFYDHYDNGKRAQHHFGKVSSGSRRYASARYHLGVLATGAKNPRTGVTLFRESLKRAQADKNQSVVELASLALARLAFEVGSYNAARHFYRRVPRTSRHYPRAQFELAWTEVMAERYRDALGTIHGLHTPFLRQLFAPDRQVLEAATYLNLCRYREATQALKRWGREVGPGVERLRTLLDERLAPGALLKAVRALAAGKPSSLPAFALPAAVADVRVYRAHQSLVQIEAEQRLAQTRLEGPAQKAVLASLRKRRNAFLVRLDLELNRRLRDVLVSLDAIKVKADEIGLEVELAEKGRLEEERRALSAGQKIDSGNGGMDIRRLRVGPGQQVWPFDGEYWLDELGSYRSALGSACPKPADPGAAAKP